jgi:hypothetical protein
MINYFTYNYPRPKPDELFSIDVEVAGCPWADSHRLVRIGFRGREIADPVVRKDVAQQKDGTPVTIAREVKIQVEFNSAMVTSRRLMGSAVRKAVRRDVDDAHHERPRRQLERARAQTPLRRSVGISVGGR